MFYRYLPDRYQGTGKGCGISSQRLNMRIASFISGGGTTAAAILQACRSGRIINQHPGPLDPGRPDFGGKGMFGRRVHAARLLFVNQTGHDFWTEATSQRVAENFNEGPVLNRKQLNILPDDTVETLAARLL